MTDMRQKGGESKRGSSVNGKFTEGRYLWVLKQRMIEETLMHKIGFWARSYGCLLISMAIVGCAQDSARIDLKTYAPVIDVKGHGYDQADYARDLDECRTLGVRVHGCRRNTKHSRRRNAKMP